MNDAAQRILFERLHTCADQLEARIEASDPLSDNDLNYIVLTLRDLADLAAPAAETTAVPGGKHMNAKDTIMAAMRGEGCLGKATEDEEVFVLRAQDAHAPLLVQFWATIVDHAAGGPTAKAAGARQVAAQMLTWQSRNHKKLPD